MGREVRMKCPSWLVHKKSVVGRRSTRESHIENDSNPFEIWSWSRLTAQSLDLSQVSLFSSWRMDSFWEDICYPKPKNESSDISADPHSHHGKHNERMLVSNRGRKRLIVLRLFFTYFRNFVHLPLTMLCDLLPALWFSFRVLGSRFIGQGIEINRDCIGTPCCR